MTQYVDLEDACRGVGQRRLLSLQFPYVKFINEAC